MSKVYIACTARESEEKGLGGKGKKNATDALFVFERKKKNGEQQGPLNSRVFYESPARYMFVKLKRFKNQVNISALLL